MGDLAGTPARAAASEATIPTLIVTRFVESIRANPGVRHGNNDAGSR